MPTGPGYAANNNTYVPIDISGRLRIGFSRNATRFHLPRYCQYVETPKGNGYFLKLTAQEAARVVNIQDFTWPDGQPDVATDQQTESFNFIPFTTQRYRYGFRIGQKAEKQAVWPIAEQNAQIKAAQMMTARTVRVLSQATSASTWTQASDPDNLSSDHTSTAKALSGGTLDQGTSTTPFVRIALMNIAGLINQDTLGVVDSDPETFFVLMNPRTASMIGSSSEIHEYIKGSYWAMDEIRRGQHPNGKYGLPSSIYGFNVIVENAVQVITRKGEAALKQYVLPNQTILVVSRVGGIEGVYGAPSFSTLSLFWYQDEMTIETKEDSWNRLHEGRVVEDTYEAVTCPASGYLITTATST